MSGGRRVPNIAVVGGQWGDEGKGKVVDLISEHFAVVARFQGGPNAGHTVTIGDRRHAVHQVPSGVFRPGVRIVIGNGTVVDPEKLIEELDQLTAAGFDLADRLFISDRAHVILPLLQQLDALSENSADPGARIGTTQRGIGPTYEAKAARWGIRVADLSDPIQLERRIQRMLDGPAGRRLRDAGEQPEAAAGVARRAHAQWRRLAPHVADTAMLLNDWIDGGANVLFEGAQGTLLDLDHGWYPYVTSSSTMAGGVCAGLGLAPKLIGGVLGVFKAYASRVGAGPMPTECDDGPGGVGERLRERGREYGTTTGRPRRCGWFDGVAARYANRINRFDCICVTLLDVLDAFDTVRIAVEYRVADRRTPTVPPSVAGAMEPVFETLAGWGSDTTGIRAWDALPEAARRYLGRIEEIVGAEVALAGVGPERGQSLVRPGSWLARQLGR